MTQQKGGHRIDCSKADHNKFKIIQFQMTWIAHPTVQEDQRRYPEVQLEVHISDQWERNISDNGHTYNLYLQDLWNAHTAR
eukprot:8894195-Prorocentrum_lima.AAC.1